MKLVLVLVLSVSADIIHEDIIAVGCSDTDGEVMFGLDGEAIWYADFTNKKGVDVQPDFVDHMTYPDGYQTAEVLQQVCRMNMRNNLRALENFTLQLNAPVSLMVYHRDDLELGEENHLLCYVTGFYPAPVKVYWTKNGQNVTDGTSLNVPYPNKDGTFSQLSTLKFVPQLGDIYSCTVEHRALDQPLTRMWDVDLNQSDLRASVFCGLGLALGLLGVASGTFFLIKGSECH